MSNDNTTEIGRDAYGNIIATGNGNVFNISSPFAAVPQPKPPELPAKID